MKAYVRALAQALACLGAWSVATVSHAAVTAEWNLPAATTLEVGTTFDVTFGVRGFTGDAGSSLGLYDMDVLYSSGSLVFLGGGFGPAGAPASNPLDYPEPSSSGFLGGINPVSAGAIDVFALSGNSQSVLDSRQPDDMSLFHLSFQALAVDPHASIRVDLTDPYLLFGGSQSGADAGVSMGRSELSLNITPSVPEPRSVFMLGAGAILLLWGARRRAN